MAEAFARQHGLDARSGGSRPLGHVLQTVVEAMREKGIDVSGYPSKEFDGGWITKECDLIVTMGCGDDACPAFVGKKIVDWKLDDPRGRSFDDVRRIRDEVERSVRGLINGSQ